MNDARRLVAHRGSIHDLPENTLLALRSAVSAGARYVEFDLQMSSDRVPVLLHDETLKRTTGESGRVMDRSTAELGRISAHCPERFGDTYRGEIIPTLQQAVTLLNQTPEVAAFVEAKRQSLDHWGVRVFIDRIMQDMQAARFEWVLISFIRGAVEYARRRHDRPIGWILRWHNEASRKAAQRLGPEYLFCNVKRMGDPAQGLWPGPWQWVLYDIVHAAEARRLLQASAALIETGCTRDLLQAMADGT
jgi:glycerophosphoryl diester phosphodiesterase